MHDDLVKPTYQFPEKALVFGDSGSSIHQQPIKIMYYPATYMPFSPPFPKTRFSSGKVITDFLKKEIKEIEFQDQHVYSIPGATSYSKNYTHYAVQEEKRLVGSYLVNEIPSLPHQVQKALSYLKTQKKSDCKKHVGIFWIGHNDLLAVPYHTPLKKNWVRYNKTGFSESEFQEFDKALMKTCEVGAHKISQEIWHLITQGHVQHFWIFETAWLQTTPRFIRLKKVSSPKMCHLIDNMSIWYNKSLKSMLAQLQRKARAMGYGVKISYIPSRAILDNETPPAPFQKETAKKVWLEEYEKTSGIMFNPYQHKSSTKEQLSEYFYYDDIHMAEAGHRFIANGFIDHIYKNNLISSSLPLQSLYSPPIQMKIASDELALAH